MLQSGYAQVDITPHLGVSLEGYFHPRAMEGILDPLQATAVAFGANKKAIIIALDLIGINQRLLTALRKQVGAALDIPFEGVFIHCSHTHLGPGTVNSKGIESNPEYIEFLKRRISDVAVMAMNDLAPTTLSFTRNTVQQVAYVRRFRMKDGSVRTNPPPRDPDIVAPIGEPDENVSLLILKREGKPEIGIVNFQVHPDVIGGNLVSADFPGFVRRTYEAKIPNSRCLYINGTQGDTNHIDNKLLKGDPMRSGYGRSRYMGEKIAMAAISNYFLAEEISNEGVDYLHEDMTVYYNKGRADQMEEAQRIHERYVETGSERETLPHVKGMLCTTMVAEAERIVNLSTKPDTFTLPMTALRVGDFALACFPGEAFTGIGVAAKEGSPFALTMTACCANGYEGYFPTTEAFADYSYETATARFRGETGDLMIETSLKLLNQLR